MRRSETVSRHPRGACWAVSLALTLLASAGCQRPTLLDPPTSAADGPIGAELYESRLAEASGTELSSLRLTELATDAESAIEARMDEIARTIQPVDDWRPVFEEIRRDHPPTVEEVLAAYRREVAAAADFLAERDWVTLPPARPGVTEVQSPIVRRNFSLALYINGVLGIITAAGDEPDPGYLANHCNVCIPPLAVHEAYPGHHVAFYHAAIDRNGLSLGDAVEIHGQPENHFFHEGWGLYSELMMLAAGYYEDPAQELAAWRMVLLRATRARLDAQLHRGDLSTEEAESVYQDRLLMERQAAVTEVRRHFQKPVSKATYLVGLLQLQTLSRQVMAAGTANGLRAFHDRLLRQPRAFAVIARAEFSLELAELAPLDLEAAPTVPRPSAGRS